MKRKFFILMLAIFTIINVIGCKKKKTSEEPEVIVYSEDEYLELSNKYNQVKNELAIYDDSYKTKEAFKKKSVLQSGIMEFNKIKDKIVLNGTLTNINNFDPGANKATIKLGGQIEVDASDWVVQSKSDNIDVAINNHCYGKIYTKKFIGDYYDINSTIHDYIEPYLSQNNIEITEQRDTFLGNTFVGQEAAGNIMIVDTTKYRGDMTIPAIQIIDSDSLSDYGLDQESEVNIKVALGDELNISAKIRVGMSKINDSILCYEFISLDKIGDTFINNLINSIKIKGNNLHID